MSPRQSAIPGVVFFHSQQTMVVRERTPDLRRIERFQSVAGAAQPSLDGCQIISGNLKHEPRCCQLIVRPDAVANAGYIDEGDGPIVACIQMELVVLS